MDRAIATARAIAIIGAVLMVFAGAEWLLPVILQLVEGTAPPATGHSSRYLFPIAGIICIPSGAVWLVLELIRLRRKLH